MTDTETEARIETADAMERCTCVREIQTLTTHYTYLTMNGVSAANALATISRCTAICCKAFIKSHMGLASRQKQYSFGSVPRHMRHARERRMLAKLERSKAETAEPSDPAGGSRKRKIHSA